MAQRFQTPFQPVNSSAPGFNMTVNDTSTNVALQSTSVREWTGPSGSVRLANNSTADCHWRFCSSTGVTSSTGGVLLLGNTVEIFTPVRGTGQSHLAAVATTDFTLNITLGYGV